jgi:predicted negative regulator of RcsB-dependent stress response
MFQSAEQGFSTLLSALKASPDSQKAAEITESGVEDRLNAVRIGLALAWQEQGNPSAMRAALDEVRKSGNLSLRNLSHLHLARGLRDLGLEEEARAELNKMFNPVPLHRWLAEIVRGTLDLRAGRTEEAAARWLQALPLREKMQQASLEQGGLLDLERRIRQADNSDDILLTAALQNQSEAWRDILKTYVGGVLGSGDRYLRKQFQTWRSAGQEELHSKLAATVASHDSQWRSGRLAAERRILAFESLRKNLANVAPIKADATAGLALWNAAVRRLEDEKAELLIILPFRPFQLDREISRAIEPGRYAWILVQPGGKLSVGDWGLAAHLEARARELVRLVNLNDPKSGAVVRELSRPLNLPAASGPAGRRLYLMASGEMQHCPWALLEDASGKSLLDRSTIVTIADVTMLGPSGLAPKSRTLDASFIGLPELTHYSGKTAGELAGTMSSGLAWSEADRVAGRAVARQLSQRFSPFRELAGPEASEAALASLTPVQFLHLHTHGNFLAGQANVPAADRSMLLLTPGNGQDGILLASEAKFLRLDATQLVALAVCEAGSGKTQRREPLEGFRRAFHFAGAKSVLAPLWVVSGRETSLLLSQIYANSEMPLAEALRDAQLKMRARRVPAKEWASWILSGQPGSLDASSRSSR